MQAAVNALKAELRTQQDEVERWEQRAAEARTRVDVIQQAIAVMSGITPGPTRQALAELESRESKPKAKAKAPKQNNGSPRVGRGVRFGPEHESGQLRYYQARSSVGGKRHQMVEADGLHQRRARLENVEKIEHLLAEKKYLSQREITDLTGIQTGDVAVCVRVAILRGNVFPVGFSPTDGRSTRILRHKDAPDPLPTHDQSMLDYPIARWADEAVGDVELRRLRNRHRKAERAMDKAEQAMKPAEPSPKPAEPSSSAGQKRRETVVQPGIGVRSGRIAVNA